MEELLYGNIRMRLHEEHFRLSTDSMILADFAQFTKNSKVCDLGCGCGALSLLLLGKDPTLNITALEIQEDAAKTAQENAEKNGFSANLQVLCADLREHRTVLAHGSFDGVIANPPYFPVADGYVASSSSLACARSELTCTLDDLCRCAAWLLPTGGRFFLVHKPQRLTDLFCTLRAHGLEVKRLRMVKNRADSAPSLVLLEARRGGSAGVTVETDLVLSCADGTPSEEYRRIYHQEG